MWEVIGLIAIILWGWQQHRSAKRTANAVEHLALHFAGPLPKPEPMKRGTKILCVLIGTSTLLLFLVAEIRPYFLLNLARLERGYAARPEAAQIKPGYKVRTRLGSSMEACTIAETDKFETNGPVLAGEWTDIEVTAGPNRGCKGVVLP